MDRNSAPGGGNRSHSLEEDRVIGVVGAGLMGRQIAGLLLDCGCDVHLMDVAAGALAQAGSWLQERLPPEALHRLQLTTSLRALSCSGVVVETVTEQLLAKRQVLDALEEVVSPRCLVATNTSCLRVSMLGGRLRNPERFCGLHFCHPLARRHLVEVIPASATSPETLARAECLMHAAGRMPLRVSDTPGFLLNRLLMPYLNAALSLLSGGSSIHRIERIARDTGMPYGPFRFLDEIGLDVALQVGATLLLAFPQRVASCTAAGSTQTAASAGHVRPRSPAPGSAWEPSPLLIAMYKSGHRGRKVGAGFFHYPAGSDPESDPCGVNPALEELLGDPTDPEPPRGSGRRTECEAGLLHGDSDRKVAARLFGPMAAEARHCLAERVVSDPADLVLALREGAGHDSSRGLPGQGAGVGWPEPARHCPAA
jgi:3-hydroxyacyl-CoA dehydrogenase